MSTKKAYKEKVEAELDLVEAKLAELKAEAKNSAADVHIKYAEHTDKLEQMIITTKAKLKELDDAREDAWEHLKEGVESAWDTLSAAVQEAAAKFKK